MKSAVSEKGQVTIPKAVRDRLGLRPGTLIDFRAEDGRLIGTKAVSDDVFRKWRGRGKLPGRLSVDEYLRRVREGHAHGRRLERAARRRPRRPAVRQALGGRSLDESEQCARGRDRGYYRDYFRDLVLLEP